MCRFGGRSAVAVNLLAEADFTHVYNITDGMEGDMVDDSKKHLARKEDEKRLEELRITMDLRSQSGTDATARALIDG
jgi:hypothetical protein